MKRMGLAAAIALSVSVPTPVAFADDLAEAERLYSVGQKAFDAKQYNDALAAWEKSYALSKEPGLLFNIAQAQRLRAQAGDCDRALTNYRRFIELDPTSPQRKLAEEFMSEVEKCASHARLRGQDEHGVHGQSGVAGSSSANEIQSQLSPRTERVPANPGRAKQIAGLASFGTGAALLATGLYFGHRALAISNEISEACDMGCNWGELVSKDADGKSAQTKQYVFYGLGGAALVTGGVLYWLGAGSKHEQAPNVGLVVGAHGASVSWGGRW